MSETEMTLQELFALPGKTLPPYARYAVQSNHLLLALKEALAKESKAIKWDAVSNVVADKTVEMLDIPLLDILIQAWKKYREVEKFADQAKYPPGDTQLVSLAEHSVKSEHRPYLEILVKGVPMGRIDFTLMVEFTLEGFLLEIRGGRIKAIRTGALKGQGSLALGSAVVMEKDFGTIPLPGTIDLGDGINLRGEEKPRAASASGH